MTFNYDQFISRNQGYIPKEVQNEISKTRLLIAGCGIGSQLADSASRMGFCNFHLVDGDTVDIHNLNRQFFFFDQVGKSKVEALKDNILRINPISKVKVSPIHIDSQNAKALVQESDIIFDTIDFLDLSAIVALHDEALLNQKTVFSSFSVGFGAALIYIPPQKREHSWIRDIFSLPVHGSVENKSYALEFINLFKNLSPIIDSEVVKIMSSVFQEMADGKVCPAPQISSGAHSVAALGSAALAFHFRGENLPSAPLILINDLKSNKVHSLIL
jgi:molybdopterin/thiamine biosynthesis adenylyltransferase